MKMNEKIIKLSALSALLLTPTVAFAQPGPFPGTLVDVITDIVCETVFPILWIIAVAFVIIMFVIAGFKFLTAQGEASKVAEGRQAVVWGLVGAAVIILAWSVIFIVGTELGVGGGAIC